MSNTIEEAAKKLISKKLEQERKKIELERQKIKTQDRKKRLLAEKSAEAIKKNKIIQESLSILGYYSGPIDGRLGIISKTAIGDWQRETGKVETLKLSDEEISMLQTKAIKITRKRNLEIKEKEISKRKKENKLKLQMLEKESEEKKKLDAERKIKKIKIAKTSKEAAVLFSDIEKFVKVAKRNIKVLELIRLYHAAKNIISDGSELNYKRYSDLDMFSKRYSEFMQFRKSEGEKRIQEINNKMSAIKDRLKAAEEFLYDFMIQNVSSPLTPKILKLIPEIKKHDELNDLTKLSAVEIVFKKFLSGEGITPHFTLWKKNKISASEKNNSLHNSSPDKSVRNTQSTKISKELNDKQKSSPRFNPEMSKQKKFIEIVKSAIMDSDKAENDMVRGGILDVRNKKICKLLQHFRIDNWTGKVIRVDSNSNGKGVLYVEIYNDITLQTWNNAMSDIVDKTLIQPGTKVFTQASKLKSGNKVKFSGSFVVHNETCISEQSMRLRGKVEEPEFTFRFSSISRIN